MSSSNGWDEYKKLFESDREENGERFRHIDEQLREINSALIRIETQRDAAKWFGGYIIPAIVAFVVTAVGVYLRH